MEELILLNLASPKNPCVTMFEMCTRVHSFFLILLLNTCHTLCMHTFSGKVRDCMLYLRVNVFDTCLSDIYILEKNDISGISIIFT